MPKRRQEELLTPEQRELQKQGQKALRTYFQGAIGRQKIIAESIGIYASMLSRMSCGHTAISLEVAIALDVATNGELRAEVLCPIQADVLQRFIRQRQMSAEVLHD